MTTKCFCNEDGLSQEDFLRRVSRGETFYTHSELEKDLVVAWLDTLDPKSHNGVVVAGNTPWYVSLALSPVKKYSFDEFECGKFYSIEEIHNKAPIFIKVECLLNGWWTPIFVNVLDGTRWQLGEFSKKYYEVTPKW